MNEENEYFANYEGGPGDASVYINREIGRASCRERV